MTEKTDQAELQQWRALFLKITGEETPEAAADHVRACLIEALNMDLARAPLYLPDERTRLEAEVREHQAFVDAGCPDERTRQLECGEDHIVGSQPNDCFACLATAHDELLALVRQYRDDMRHGVSTQDSRNRRIAAINAVLGEES